MAGVDAALLHSNVPAKAPAVSTELPQLSNTAIVGAAGIGLGAEMALAAGLIHPFTVCVTLYAAMFNTVIDEVVAPLLQCNEPVELFAVSTELPQLL